MSKVTFRDYRDFLIWLEAWIEGKKRLDSKEIERLLEMARSVPLSPIASAPKLAAANPEPPKPKPAMSSGEARSAGP